MIYSDAVLRACNLGERADDATLLEQMHRGGPGDRLVGLLAKLDAQKACQWYASHAPLVHSALEVRGVHELAALAQVHQHRCAPAKRIGQVAIEIRWDCRACLV